MIFGRNWIFYTHRRRLIEDKTSKRAKYSWSVIWSGAADFFYIHNKSFSRLGRWTL